jgi:transcriptional regulator with XRE-family HTH domain
MTQSPTATAGANVRGEMARRGVTQEAVGKALRLSQPAVSKRLRGDVPFDINELATIAALLDVPLERLTEGVAA